MAGNTFVIKLRPVFRPGPDGTTLFGFEQVTETPLVSEIVAAGRSLVLALEEYKRDRDAKKAEDDGRP